MAALLHDEAGGSAAHAGRGGLWARRGTWSTPWPSWPTDPRFTPTDRAALAVAEQFVIDCHGVTDAQVAGLRDALGDQRTVGFLIALALFDGFSRAATVLRGF